MARAHTPAAFHSMDYHVHSIWIGIAPLLRCPVRRRALARALGAGQCAAASCQSVGSAVGVVVAARRAAEAHAGEGVWVVS